MNLDMHIMACGPLLLGWILDRIFGDPSWLPHPVVGFGKVIAGLEHRLNHGGSRKVKGAVMALSLVTAVFVAVWALLWLLDPYPVIKLIVETIGVFYCLAGTTLGREVRMVFQACDRGLKYGRKQLSRIVGRDTDSLDDREIKTAALETLAENLSDGVIAPLFWYMLLGLPGMMAYKMINTLDSMVGYKNDRYREYGCFSARLDDAVNYIPARLTALLMVVVTFRFGLLKFVKRYGRCHASPNSGYPESALAGILNCRFGGTHDYFGEAVYKPYIGDNARQLTSNDMKKSISVCFWAEVVMLLITIAIRFALV